MLFQTFPKKSKINLASENTYFSGLAFVFESVTSLYFGLELFTRFLCCDKKVSFLFDFLNIIDLLDLLIYLTYALTRFLAIQQYGPGSRIQSDGSSTIQRKLQIRDSSNFGKVGQIRYFFESPLFVIFS